MRLPRVFSFLGVSLATLLALAAGPVSAEFIVSHNGHNLPEYDSTDFFIGSGDIKVSLGCNVAEAGRGDAGVGVDCDKVFGVVDTHTTYLGGASHLSDFVLPIYETVYNLTGVGWTDYHIELDGAVFVDGHIDENITVEVSDDYTMLWLFFDEELLPTDSFDIGVYIAALPEAVGITISQTPTTAVPEPTTLLLLGLGLAGLGFARKRLH